MITYGSNSSKTCCIFFHGWTDTPQHLLENTRHLMDPLLFWVIPYAPFNNMWFDYKYTHQRQDDYGKLLESNDLILKNKKELLDSIDFICNIINNIEVEYESIPKANHFFEKEHDILVRKVNDYLDTRLVSSDFDIG